MCNFTVQRQYICNECSVKFTALEIVHELTNHLIVQQCQSLKSHYEREGKIKYKSLDSTVRIVCCLMKDTIIPPNQFTEANSVYSVCFNQKSLLN